MAKVLIVDDSKTSRRILKNFLTQFGHEVVGEAENGEMGVEMYKNLKPDVVTLDITMPVMDGVEALEKISTNSLTLGIREFIRQAKEEGYVTALLFDQDCARTITESLHIASLFDRILPSRDEPQTDAFVKAADALDLQKQECVAFVSSSAAAAMVRATDLRCVAVGQSEASFYSDYHIRDFRNQNAGILIRKAEGE